MKKIKITYVFFALLVVCSTTVNGKSNGTPNNRVNMYGILFYQPRGLEGSPYLFGDWCTGTVHLYNGQVAENLLVKFNILNNDLIFYNETFKNLFTADRETVTSFYLETKNNRTLKFIKYKQQPLGYKLQTNDFVHQIYSGKLQLLAKYTASISDANDLNSRDKINPKTFYFIVDNDEAKEIKLKLKSIIKLYPDRKQEIKKLASNLHFHKKSVDDMIRLIQAIE